MSIGCCSVFSLLTRDPASGQSHDFSVGRDWFPVIGLTIGLLVMALGQLGNAIDPWFGAVLALLAWYGITNGAHATGAASMADQCATSGCAAPGGGAVAFGAAGALQITLLVVAKLVLLMLLIDNGQWWALVLIPAWARLGAAWCVTSVAPMANDVMAQSLSEKAQQEGNATGFWALALWLLGGALSPLMWLAPLVIGGWFWMLRNKLGGMRGAAIHGGVEWCEVGLMLLASALLGLIG
ncbi:MAG: adenosylcobinamide-GDP ribazoletransferase [Mariprofundales bacterium]